MPRKKAVSKKINTTASSQKVDTLPPVMTPKSNKSIDRRTIIAAIIVAVLLLIAWFVKTQLLVATVNGSPITRFQVINELEKQGGKSVVDTLITKTLVDQEARKQHVSISDKEVNDEITKIENNVKGQGQNLDQLLAANNTSREGLKDEVRTQKLIEKLLGKDIQVSDKEIDAYISQNKDSLAAETDPSKLRSDVKQQLEQQKLQTKFQTWLQDLKSKAKITYFKTY